MHAKEVLKHSLNMNREILKGYLSDLSDADLWCGRCRTPTTSPGSWAT